MSPTQGAGYSEVAAAKPPPPNAAPLARAHPRPYKRNQKGQFRPIVVDGCNVGFAYARNDRFDAEGLRITYEYFVNKGYDNKDIHIIVKHMPRLSEECKATLETLRKIGVLQDTPSRLAGGEIIRRDDDLFILETALEIGGIVLSKDRYKQYWDPHPKYREVIRDRLVQPTFIGDKLILPQDPLGKKGPCLDKFLRFDG